MRYNLPIIKEAMYSMPHTKELRDKIEGFEKELREMTLRKSRFDPPNMDFVQKIRTSLIKEILGE